MDLRSVSTVNSTLERVSPRFWGRERNWTRLWYLIFGSRQRCNDGVSFWPPQVIIACGIELMYFGRLDPAPRAPLELPAHFKNNKDGSFTCKQHGNANCKSCCGFQILNLIFLDSSHLVIVGWKKQITKLHKEGKKAASKKKDSGTNLYWELWPSC